MINESDIIYVKKLLQEKGIDKLIGLDGKYYDAFVDLICWNYRNTDSAIWVNSKYQRIGNFYVKALSSFLGALASWGMFIFKYRKFKIKRITQTNLAIPFGGDHVRFKYVYDLLGDDTSVIYPPLYHYTFIKAHIDCFENQNKHIYLGSFQLRDIFAALWTIITHIRSIKMCHNAIDSHFERSYGSLVSVIITSVLYRGFIHRMIKHISDAEIIRRWFFDYDFEYKYIVFNNEIKKVRPHDVTYHVQHGAFLGFNDAYCNPVSDVSLCCSLREKRIIEKSNKYHSKICAQGSSWQSIDKSENVTKNSSFVYDILVLLTDTVVEKTTRLQQKLLQDISTLDCTVLVRYRPQSAQLDKEYLESYTHGMKVSDGTTLKQDILNAKSVVCFSEDAVYECFRNNKKVCFLTKDISCYNLEVATSDNMIILSPETYNPELLRILLKNSICDYTDDAFVRFNFGDFEFQKVKANLQTILN